MASDEDFGAHELAALDPAKLAKLAESWAPESRAAMIEYLRTAHTRKAILEKYKDVTELARAVDPNFVITPALKLIGACTEVSLRHRRRNLIINLSPQEGKSTLAAQYLPLRALQINPNTKIILTTYAESLALDHSRAIRDVITRHGSNVLDGVTGVAVEDKLGFQLSPVGNKVDTWKVANGRGGLIAAGLHGTITGRGADCVSGDTCIITEHGEVSAERAYRENHAWIWSYDHSAGVAGWHRVEARRRIDGRRLVTIRTQAGRVLRCTSDHRIYTRRGYVAAGGLGVSDQILSFSSAPGMSVVRGGISDPGAGHSQGHPSRSKSVLLQHVRQFGIWSATKRAYARAVRGVPGLPLGVQTPECRSEVLHAEMWVRGAQGTHSQTNADVHSSVSHMRQRVSSEVLANDILQSRVRRSEPLSSHDRERELALQDGYKLRKLVPAHAAVDLGTRWWNVRGLWSEPASVAVRAKGSANRTIAVGHSPHQREAAGQRPRELDHAVHDVSYRASQIGYDTVSEVVRDGGGEVAVYDFQVASARNFFAGGLLVHNCMIIDDPYKDMEEADSETQRAKVSSWMRSVARTRLSPQASIILIQTRWHPLDLAGEILEAEKKLDPRYRTWRHINIPAIAEEGIYDSLGRDPGEHMVSARGERDWEETRRDVGERTWYSLYQGSPRNPSGGLFKRSWFTDPLDIPPTPVAGIVGIDPADSGKNDETGIIGGYLCANGKVLLARDWSGQFTSDEWSTRAVLLALEMGAREISMEAYASADTYVTMLKRAWTDVHNAAMAKKRAGAPLSRVEKRACAADMPFAIRKWRGRSGSDAVARSGLMRQAFETGKAKVAPVEMSVFVEQACDWQSGQHQPDRVAAAVIVHDRLVKLSGGQMTTATPTDDSLSESTRPRPDVATVTPIWLRRSLKKRAS